MMRLAWHDTLEDVATHEEYPEAVPAYRELDGLVTELRLPKLATPRDALARLLQRRIDAAEVDAEAGDVIDGEGLVRLEAEYDARPRDLRHTLLIAHVALRQAGPPYPEALGSEQIRSAGLML
jgi:hypothetical protein